MKVVRSSNKCELKLNVLAINCERLSHKHDMRIKYVVNFGTIFSGSILSFHSNLNQVGVTLTKCKIDGWSFLKSSDELGAQFENLLSFLKMACTPSQKNLWNRTFLFSQRERFPFPPFTVLFRGQILSQSASDFQIC